MTTKKLQLTETANGQANYLNVNEALQKLDQLVMPVVADKDLTSPPGSPADGSAYIVASGNWGTASSKAKQIAYWLAVVGEWQFAIPSTGWAVGVLDEPDVNGVPRVYTYNGTDWVVAAITATAAPAETITDATTARVLVITDSGKYLRFTSTSAKALTVPPQSSVSWVADTEVHVRNHGASNLTLTPGSGVGLNPPYAGTLVVPPGGTVTLKRVASDSWDVMGQTV